MEFQFCNSNCVNHWSVFESALNGTRCKAGKCARKTYRKCTKCKVHLCLNSTRSCFIQYHTQK